VASVHARLLTRSRETREDFQFLLQRYAAERFLYRLGESPHRDRYILKGATLFAIWGSAIYRGTRDLDFTGYGTNEVGGVLAAIRDICAVPVADDGISFDTGTLTAKPIREQVEYDGLRVQFQARLGVARIPMQVDIGFGNAIEPPPTESDYPSLLDLPLPRIRAYPQEAVVAEKLHAMVVFGERNSRYKDFYDLYVFARQFPFDGDRLTTAIAATFERRRTTVELALPAVLTPRFYTEDERAQQWSAYLARNRLPGAPADWAAVGELLQAFLAEPWRAVADGRAFSDTWLLGGPWVSSITQEAVAENVRCALQQFTAYPAYKDSGVEWLGEIPDHWRVQRLKQLAGLNPESLPEDTDPAREIVYVDIGGVNNLGRIVEREQLTFGSAPSRARRIVRDGDVIVSTVRTYLRAIASISSPEPGMVVSTGFAVVRPDDGFSTDYAAYALRGPYFVERVVANSKGASYPAINEGEMATYELAVPPECEQRAIAAFLDRETARIDTLVAKKERLIALLQEKRTALITRAVTKGLDAKVRMENSGVEWLGKIPAHWNLLRFKLLFRDIYRYPTYYDIEYVPDGVPEVRGEALVDGAITALPDQRYITAETNTRFARTILQEGDLVISVRGTMGKVGLVLREFVGANITANLLKLSPRKNVATGRYLSWLLRSDFFLKALDRQSPQTTIQTITMAQIATIVLPIPGLGDQNKIAAFLDRETARIDALVAKVGEAIERLKELRAALISAAVTGKIDVREQAS
jgi:type I restriction enzyme S subunit